MATPQIEEVSPEALAFLRGVDSPTIANAIEPFKVRDRTDGFVGGGVRCLFPEMGPMVGYALTVTMTSRPGPVASRDGYWRMWEALERMPAPSVLAIQDVSGTPTRCAHCGEVMATLARRLGAVGIVADGGVRDLEEVRALGIHYFASSAIVAHGNSEILEVGVLIELDGQTVRPGDLLHGDANGIVIVPTGIVGDLSAAVEEVRAREKETMDYVKSEGFSLAALRGRSGY